MLVLEYATQTASEHRLLAGEFRSRVTQLFTKEVIFQTMGIVHRPFRLRFLTEPAMSE